VNRLPTKFTPRKKEYTVTTRKLLATVRKFKWRSRGGEFHKTKDMETRHLFYTLKMIWNHSAPEKLRLKPYREYYFSEFYQPEYMKDAVEAILAELNKRTDLCKEYRDVLKYMQDSFNKVYTKRRLTCLK